MRAQGHLLRSLVSSLLVAVLLALFARTWIVQIFRIPSSSMEPGLRTGDHVMVNKFIYGPNLWPWEQSLLPLRGPRRGDVVVFKFPRGPDRRFVKRCIGLPKDRVETVDKRLLLNDQLQAEEGYVVHRDARVYTRSLMLDDGYRKRDNFGPVIVPAKQIFLLGDNRDESYDSRFWGLVPESYLKGRPFAVLWSWGRETNQEDESKVSMPRLVR